MSSYDPLSVCRLCLTKAQQIREIFADVGEDDVSTDTKIHTWLPIKVLREDKFSHIICESCFFVVDQAYNLWKTCLNADKQLREWQSSVNTHRYTTVTTMLDQDIMKGEQSNENRLDGSVMSGHQNSMNMDMDNMQMMSIMMPNNNQQQLTSVPIDTSGGSIQNIQVIAGSSTQPHEIIPSQTNVPTQQEEEEDESTDDSEDEGDEGDEGLPIKEESEEDPNNSRTIEPTTFVNVSLHCDEAGPSGIRQQKISDIQELAQAADIDPKTGCSSTDNDMKKKVICIVVTKSWLTSSEMKQVARVEGSSSAKRVNSSAATGSRQKSAIVTSHAASLKKIHCDICDITLRESQYKKHLIKHSSRYDFQCDVCKKKFKHKVNMNVHKMKIHGEAPTYSCQYCDFSTIHSSYLQVHFMRKHTDNFHFSCDKCDRKFRVKADYTKHLITHEDNPCICDVCGSALANKLALYFHKNYKHRVKDTQFQCPVCKKKLQTQKNLDSHVQQHKQRYMCEECGMELTRKTSLKRHIKTHTGEKSYLCNICGKAFASATGRKVHLLTHLEVRPYVCTICKKSFTQRPALSVHWKKKHPDITDAPPPVRIKNIIETITVKDTK